MLLFISKSCGSISEGYQDAHKVVLVALLHALQINSSFLVNHRFPISVVVFIDCHIAIPDQAHHDFNCVVDVDRLSHLHTRLSSFPTLTTLQIMHPR